MSIPANRFFQHFNAFFDYRQDIYEISSQTLKSNRIDLALFENFIRSRKQNIIDGPAVIDFQYHLKKQRKNCGASINRKIFTLRSMLTSSNCTMEKMPLHCRFTTYSRSVRATSAARMH